MLAPVLVTPPTATPVTLDEAKLHLRVDGEDEDTKITSCIESATEHLDGYAGILGRCLMPQTWSQEFEAARGDLVLPLSPVISATVQGFSGFRILQDGRGHFLRLNDGEAWPVGPVTVEFVAGYSGRVPRDICEMILLDIGTLYKIREELGEKYHPSNAYMAKLAKYRTRMI